MRAMYGLFDKPDAAQRAYTGLKRAGIFERSAAGPNSSSVTCVLRRKSKRPQPRS